jgi:predicted transcriptional regulator
VISEHRPTTVVKILETAFFNNGANLVKLIDKSRLTEYPEKLKLYLLILENSGLIAYHKTDGVYRTTYKRIHFLRTYNHIIDLLSNFEKSQEVKV